MKFLLSLLLVFSVVYGWDSFNDYPPMSVLYHPVTTKNKLAQECFDRGLLAIYAFNYDQAVKEFDRASQFDPQMAMAYWGMALTLDENIDTFVSANHARLTYDLSHKAMALSKEVTTHEQDYIQALSTRFSEDPDANKKELRAAYSEAMSRVVHNYPDDLDAATLYAESLMDDMEWDLWHADGTPQSKTLQVIALLESVLKRNPYHVGANHYTIHALEHSPYPARALPAADTLQKLSLAEWGHLLHTSSHIYLRVGEYEKSIEANLKGVKADQEYVAKYGLEGQYPLKFFAHNLFYLTLTYMWQERFSEALETAQKLHSLIMPYQSQVPLMEFNLMVPLQVYLYFHRWNEILQLPPPDQQNGMLYLFYRYAIALTYAKQGNLEKAQAAYTLYQLQRQHYLLLRDHNEGAFSAQFFTLAEDLLKAALADLEGNSQLCLEYLAAATLRQEKHFDILTWTYPIRHTLGAYLIKMEKYTEAEQQFRQALTFFARNGRSLFGLSQALHYQNKPTYSVEREAKAALHHAPQPLSLNDL